MGGHLTYSTCVGLNGGAAEYEVEATFSVDPPSGDGWNEPRDPGGVVDVRVIRIDGKPAAHYSADTVLLLEQALEDGHDGFMLDEWSAAHEPDPDRQRDEQIGRELLERF